MSVNTATLAFETGFLPCAAGLGVGDEVTRIGGHFFTSAKTVTAPVEIDIEAGTVTVIFASMPTLTVPAGAPVDLLPPF